MAKGTLELVEDSLLVREKVKSLQSAKAALHAITKLFDKSLGKDAGVDVPK